MTAVVVRAWTEPENGWPARRGRPRPVQPSRYVLVFDTETADPDQRLLLLVWRLYVDGALVTEGIAHPDRLRGKRLAMLRSYVEHHQADTEPWARRRLVLIPLSTWIDKHLHRYGYANRAAVVGFNLPFDIGTIAGGDWTASRSGGFTFRLAPRYTATTGREQRVWHRPDLSVQHIDNGAFIEWKGCVTGERDHPDGRRWRQGQPLTGTTPYRGRFVDCSTLHFALTGSHASLEGACDAWGVTAAAKVECDFGVLDERLVDHCRADVAMTAELHQALTDELAEHPGVDLADDALWSPATVAGRYLDAMGVRPLLDHLDVGPEVHAAARCASYGARTEARIARNPVPVVALDVASMYPTVSALLGTWRLWTAAGVAVEDVTDDLATWLASPGLENELYRPATWRRWGCTLVEVEADGDVLPHQFVDDADKGRLVTAPLRFAGRLWWGWPDVAAAVLLGGEPPRITRALRLRPEGRQRGLRPVQLRGGLELDPRTDDPFPFLVAARHRATDDGSAHLARFYKIAANALAHGLSGRFDHKARHHQAVVHGPTGRAPQRVRMEQPGPHAFPAISSTTTAGARLVLAMMERATTDLDGCWAHCDTDSAKVVATPDGGFVPCPGGPHRIAQEAAERDPEPIAPSSAPENAAEGTTEAVRALSWEQVRTIAARFDSLRPEGSRRPLWTVEHDSLTQPLMALVTGPKSYALFREAAGAGIELVAWTETSLGESYLSPEPQWSQEAWRWIIARALGQQVEVPAWWDHLALRREAAVNPIMARAAKASGVAARPFGFRLAATARGGAAPVAPYSRNPADWPGLDWRDRHTGEALAPMLVDDAGELVEVEGERTYTGFTFLGQLVGRIERQPVPTFDDPATGKPADHRSRGLLARRATVADRLVLVGADRTPLASKGEELDQRYPTCRRCGKPLDGRSDKQFCSDACEHAKRRSRSQANTEAEPEPERTCAWAGCSTVLTRRQPTWCAEHRKRGAMRAVRDRRRPGHRCEQPGCDVWLVDPDGAFPWCLTHRDPGSRVAAVAVEVHPCGFEGCLTSIAGDPGLYPYCVTHTRALARSDRRDTFR